MKSSRITELVEDFLDEYQDPEINKRLFFDVWADRLGLRTASKHRLWGAVVATSRRRSGQNRLWAGVGVNPTRE